MKNTIMVTPTTTVNHQWIDQEEAMAHHRADTMSPFSMQCNTENQGKDLQEEVVPHQEGQQEEVTQENLDLLKTMKA
jgi:hypothetical protein